MCHLNILLQIEIQQCIYTHTDRLILIITIIEIHFGFIP